jgi:hypothetical protein
MCAGKKQKKQKAREEEISGDDSVTEVGAKCRKELGLEEDDDEERKSRKSGRKAKKRKGEEQLDASSSEEEERRRGKKQKKVKIFNFSYVNLNSKGRGKNFDRKYGFGKYKRTGSEILGSSFGTSQTKKKKKKVWKPVLESGLLRLEWRIRTEPRTRLL